MNDVISGRYEVGELLGRGGMAEVRRATDTRLGRIVAIKKLRTDLAGDPTFQARFRREAQSAAALNHPAIVSVYDTGEAAVSVNEGTNVAQPYIVMEYVAGRTLREVLNDGRRLLPERALEITAGVLSALDYSHRMGIIHRDIKPANVMLTPQGEVKVMDFGIARAMADAHNSMTQTSAVVGTAQYLSPEQARGETVDARSDVYSTGCLLYELLTGRPPFVGDSPVSVAYQHVREQAPRPSTVDSSIDPQIDSIVMMAIAKDVDERYQSAYEMKRDIDRYLAGQPVDAPNPEATMVTTMAPTAVVPTTPPETENDDNRRRKSRRLLLGLLAALVLVIAGAILVIPQLVKGHDTQIQVPSLVGLAQQAATTKLTNEKFTIGTITRVPSETVPDGQVLASDPAAGAWANPQSPVNLKVSSGKRKVTLPNGMKGQPKDSVISALQQLGLKVNEKPIDSDQDTDTVLSADPAPGSTTPCPEGTSGTCVYAGSTITVSFSSGKQKIPAIDGSSAGDYTKELNQLGFQTVNTNQVDSNKPAGTIIDVSPEVGQSTDISQPVTIKVSSGNNTIPDVTSATTSCKPETPTTGGNGVPQNCITAAIKALNAAGFTKVVVNTDSTAQSPSGTIDSQSPGSGSVPLTTSVTITVSANQTSKPQ